MIFILRGGKFGEEIWRFRKKVVYLHYERCGADGRKILEGTAIGFYKVLFRTKKSVRTESEPMLNRNLTETIAEVIRM